MGGGDVTERTKHRRAREKVSRLLGHQLRGSADIHFCKDGSVVVCEDRSYHKLLHQRTDALEACGHADWRRCQICQEYDDPDNMRIEERTGYTSVTRAYHVSCMKQHNQLCYAARGAQKTLKFKL